MSYLLGVDAGTTGTKVVLFDESGKIIASAHQEYRLITPAPLVVELDARTYWSAFKGGVRKIIQMAGVDRGRIKALAITGQGESFVPIGKNGQPLRRTIVWLDNRSEEETKLIKDEFSLEEVYHTTGSPEIVPTWESTKILWLKGNEPEVYKKTFRYLLVEDYLIYRLTGQFVGDGSLYTSTLLFDINGGKWWDKMLDFIGISSEQLPTLMQSGEIVGELTNGAAQETGLSKDTLVVVGGMDQACGCIGSGNVGPGIVTETTGASLNICVTTETPVFDPKRRIPCQYHAVAHKYILLPWCITAGMAMKWFRDEFCELEETEARRKGLDVYDIMTQQAKKISPGSEGVVVLPHLAGALSPEMNMNARGVFFGLSLRTGKKHLIRATMESVAFMLKKNLEVLQEMGIEIEEKEIRSLGGAAKSHLWNQIKADVTGKPLVTLDSPEAACLGAAILAGNAIGLFDSLEDACNKTVSIKERFNPNPKNEEIYERNYAIYLKLYENLKQLF